MKREILLLGNEELYQISEPVKPDEIETLKSVVQDLHDTLMDFREKYHAGRAIAAPHNEMMEVLDDCMSFPNLLVKVMRHKRCRIKYLDMEWKEQVMSLEGDLSELLQHEFDHLDGILATMRAIDSL